MSSPAGWYPQPDGQQRYWDGQQWTEKFAPGVPEPGGNRSGIPWWVWLIMAFFGVIAILYLVLDALAGTHDI